MQNVRDGDLAGLSVLFERYNVLMFNFYLKMTADRDISQDLTQNLFYRIIKYRNTYKHEYPFRPWMYRMARNLFADYCRNEKREGELMTDFNMTTAEIIDEEARFSEEDYTRLDQALSMLRLEQKEVLVLSRYQGLKYSEISEVTKLSVPAIKVLIHRALKQLRGIYFKQT